MKDKNINPMTGVVKPEILKVHMKQCIEGMDRSRSYVRGALQYLTRKPPNKYIVPLLELTLRKYNERNQRT